jgi:hypothetical protein
MTLLGLYNHIFVCIRSSLLYLPERKLTGLHRQTGKNDRQAGQARPKEKVDKRRPATKA